MYRFRQLRHFIIKYSFYLRPLDTREPFQELLNRCTILEILEKRGHGKTRSAKHSGATDLARIALDSITIFPIFHHNHL